jgi:dipeptidyl aminopeptidase/acylaminoacyl peptidase
MKRMNLVSALALAGLAWATAGQPTAAQSGGSSMLTVDSIMRGPKLVGTPPAQIRWAHDSSKVYFTWRPATEAKPATWTAARDGAGLRKLTVEEARSLDDVLPEGPLDRAGRRLVAADEGDIVIADVETGARRPITRTLATETSPRWAQDDTAVTFVRDGNLFLAGLDGSGPAIVQLTDIAGEQPSGRAGEPASEAAAEAGGRRSESGETEAQRILREEQLELIEHLRREEAEKEEAAGEASASAERTPGIPRFTLGPRQRVAELQLSADGRFAWIGVEEDPEVPARTQDVPDYVTDSSYPEMISGRTNVGDARSQRLLAVLDLESGTSVWASAEPFAGIAPKAAASDPDVPRGVDWSLPDVSPDGAHSLVSVRAKDNKDRWLVTVDPATGRATVLHRQHDAAWLRDLPVAGRAGGAETGVAWLADNRRFVFLSEQSGWMHLYVMDAAAPETPARALTSGAWEITEAALSNDRRTAFLTTNEVHPGERQFYTLAVDGGAATRITTLTGAHNVTVSPDEQTLAVAYSYVTKPPELYLMPFRAGAEMTQVTTSPAEEWRAFTWIDPKLVTYKARDGAEVYARLFTPEMIGARRDPRRPAVIFVHGAGYLQEANRFWSANYYRENMFNNLLASRGYVVLSPDYRASSGYGRDWRTAIYRHMGGKDLEDVVDGARFLVETERVAPERIGVYGGSYGGFITLMAMFTTPDVFAAGAALRPVTDWMHYNHEYTSNILNVPQTDLEAFRRSSPIYFADGLKGHLLLLHGMVDTNVFYQDTVRLVQRLIELRKENWYVQPYPVESHAFTEETSWADEYRRILRLFENTLRRPDRPILIDGGGLF